VRVRRLLVPVLGLAVALGTGTAAGAPQRQVILVVVEGTSYEELLGDPVVADLARAGGIGLMTTSGGADLASRTAVNLGAGRTAEGAPAGPVPFEAAGAGLLVAVGPYRAAAGDAVPGLLGSTLAGDELLVGYAGPSSGAGHVAMLAAMGRDGLIPVAAPSDGDGAAALASDTDLVVSPDAGVLPAMLGGSAAEEVLVVVVGAGASETMRERGDAVGPIVVARGSPQALLGGGGEAAGLTSSTTRREGIVADVDVAPTVLDFLGVPAPAEMVGTVIRTEGSPPTDLHDRYLGYQRVVGPVGLTALAFALLALIAGLVVILGPFHPAPWLARVVGAATLGSAALLVALVAASVLPSYRTSAVVAALIVAAVALYAIARRLARGDPMTAVAAVAVAGLIVVVVDGVLGWPSQITPLLGGGALDGERFFGLGNAYAGIVLSGTVLAAARLGPAAGVGLIAAGSVFAGLPFLGADLGGSLSMAVAAALWFGVRRWGGLGWRSWALAAAALLTAAVLVTLGDRVLPGGGTHLTAVQGTGSVQVFLERLGENVRSTSQTPAAWLAVLGLPVWLGVALARPSRFRPTLEPDPRWRDALVVLTIGGMVGYVLNDTHGMAGVAFTFASAAMLYPTLVSMGHVGRTGPRPEAAAAVQLGR